MIARRLASNFDIPSSVATSTVPPHSTSGPKPEESLPTSAYKAKSSPRRSGGMSRSRNTRSTADSEPSAIPMSGPSTHSSALEPVPAPTTSAAIVIVSVPRITRLGPTRSASRPAPIAPASAETVAIASSRLMSPPSKSPVRRA